MRRGQRDGRRSKLSDRFSTSCDEIELGSEGRTVVGPAGLDCGSTFRRRVAS